MPTMRDVARKAGVSQAAVSYAINRNPSIPAATRKRILKAAKEIGYTTNLSAKSLRSGKTGAIGLVVQEIDNPYYIQVADAISHQALKYGEQTVIQQTLYEKKNETRILGHIVNSFCDAVIFAPTILTNAQIETQLNGKPALLLNPVDRITSSTAPVDVLDVETRTGLHEITSYVLDHGCRHPLFVGRPWRPLKDIASSRDSAWQRVAGFQQALLEHGLTPGPGNFFSPTKWNWFIVEQEMTKLLSSFEDPTHPPFDACVCANDETALGVIHALTGSGVKVPDTVSVTGFDGIAEGRLVNPQLTTEALDFTRFSDMALSAVLDRINEGTTANDHKRNEGKTIPLPPRQFHIGTKLVVRGSTR